MKTEYDVWYRDMRDFTNVALYEKFSTKYQGNTRDYYSISIHDKHFANARNEIFLTVLDFSILHFFTYKFWYTIFFLIINY